MIKKTQNIIKFANGVKKSPPEKKKKSPTPPPTVKFPLWLSISEAAKLGAVNKKTIRRAIQADKLTFKIHKDRYLIDFSSFLKLFLSSSKLKNKLNFYGIGQYINKWLK